MSSESLSQEASLASKLLYNSGANALGCWEWLRYCNGRGYSTVRWAGKKHRAHRLSYQVWRGKIPDHLEIDHLCRNRRCINPNHLELVTNIENLNHAKKGTEK